MPAAWEAEAASSATKLETGPLQGPGNFNELDGDLTSAYARSPYLVADGGDTDRKLTTRLPADSARPFMEAANKSFGDGKLDEALLNYRKVIERDPLYAKAYFYVAEIESQRRDLDAATSWNDRGLRLSARDAYGHALRAEIWRRRGAPGRAGVAGLRAGAGSVRAARGEAAAAAGRPHARASSHRSSCS